MNEWTEYTKLLAGLIAIVNPLGAIPVFLSVTSKLSIQEKHRVAMIAAFATACILLFFSIAGDAVLSFFGITLDAFRIAGGMLLLVTALGMMGVTGSKESAEAAADEDSLGIMPLALPILAGPGSISTVIVYTNQGSTVAHQLLVAAAIVTVSILVYLALRSGAYGVRMLGPIGLLAFNRIMGLIIAAISVEFILDGLAGHFPGLLA